MSAGRSLKAGGFTSIWFVAESGGNRTGMRAAAEKLNALWAGTAAKAHWIDDYYTKAHREQEAQAPKILGVAVREGVKRSNGEAAVTQDADLEYSTSDIPRLIEIYDKGSRAVYGPRNIKKRRYFSIFYYLGDRFLTFLVNVVFGSNLTDVYAGYKLFDAMVLKNISLKSDRFDFDMEITLKSLANGISIKEIPINYNPRGYKEGKKLTVLDGLRGFVLILKYFLLHFVNQLCY